MVFMQGWQVPGLSPSPSPSASSEISQRDTLLSKARELAASLMDPF